MAVEAMGAPALEVARREQRWVHFGGAPSTWCASVPGVRPYLVCGRVRLGLVGARGVRGVLRVLVLAFPSPGSVSYTHLTLPTKRIV